MLVTFLEMCERQMRWWRVRDQSIVKDIVVGLDGLDLLADLERWSQSQLHRHEQVVIPDQTQRTSVDFVFHKFVDVGLVAESRQKISDILNCPLVERSAIRMGVR